jgi:broad specificity phosphatase PhoE
MRTEKTPERLLVSIPRKRAVADVRDQFRSILNTLIREYSGQRVLLVTHHLTVLSIRATLESSTPEEFIKLDKQNKLTNCCVTNYVRKPAEGTDGKLVLNT